MFVSLAVADDVRVTLAVIVCVAVREGVWVVVRVSERVAVTTGPVMQPPLKVASR